MPRKIRGGRRTKGAGRTKLDPVLAFTADLADRESPAALRGWAAPEAPSRSPVNFADAPVGILSLSGQLSEKARAALEETDLVPALIAVNDGEQVRRAVAAWGGEARRVTPRTVTAKVPRTRLRDLERLPGVDFAEAGTRMNPQSAAAHEAAGLFGPGKRRLPRTGKGVLVGVVDSGIDVDHPSFRSNGKSRVVYYLDRASGLALDEAPAGERERFRDTTGHGTHVAGVAAGGVLRGREAYQGVAPEADLAVVKTTWDAAAVVEAVQAIFSLAAGRGQPCVVNLSLGNHYGDHDGTTVMERVIDELSGPRRVVVVAAGNEGGYPVHAEASLKDRPRRRWVAEFVLNRREVGPGPAGNLVVQVWHRHEDALRVRLRAPTGELFEAPARGARTERRVVFAVQAARARSPYSRDVCTAFAVLTLPETRWLSGWSIVVEGAPRGRKAGVQVGDVHAWIADPSMGHFLSGASARCLVCVPGTAFSAVTVGSFAVCGAWESQDERLPAVRLEAVGRGRVSHFSSPGPTRSGCNKPEIAAPGQWVISALSSAAGEEAVPPWTRVRGERFCAMQGTSMAAPYVAGAVALLLEKEPDLDWAEVKRRLMLSARQDAHTSACWNERWGYGKINLPHLLGIEPA